MRQRRLQPGVERDRRGSVQGTVGKKGAPARLGVVGEAWKSGDVEECGMDPGTVH